jgi:hypothetical protein
MCIRDRYYSLQFYDSQTGEILSKLSPPVKIYAHAPGIADSISVLNSKSLEVFFTLKVGRQVIEKRSFTADGLLIPESSAKSGDKSFVINFSEALTPGEHHLSISCIRDEYNTPFRDTVIFFNIDDEFEEGESLFITSYEILNNRNLVVKFNFSLDSVTAMNKSNYIFTPNNIVEHLEFYGDDSSVLLRTVKPFGSIGREYVLKIKDIRSSPESGSLSIRSNSGSEIVLTGNAENLDDIFVYPNPVKLKNNNMLTFANLTSRADIYIFTIDGIFIKKISEDDGNGGVDWDLHDTENKLIGSGIYFYKAIALDNFGNELQEKTGKFAVIK